MGERGGEGVGMYGGRVTERDGDGGTDDKIRRRELK